MKCEPVEQFWMAWLFAHAAEILQSFDDACTEQLLPVTVHCGPGGQRLARSKEPFREGQTSAWRALRQPRKNSWHVGSERRPDLGEEVAALKFQCASLIVRRFFGYYRQGNGRNFCQFPAQFCELDEVLFPNGIVREGLPDGIVTHREMSTPHQRRLVGDFLSLRETHFNSSAGAQFQRLGGDPDDPTRVKQTRRDLKSVGSWVIGEFALRFNRGVDRALQTRVTIRYHPTQCDLACFTRTFHDPGIDSIDDESEVRRVPSYFGIRRIDFNSQRRDDRRVDLRSQFVGLLAGDVRAGLQISVFDRKRNYRTGFGLSLLPRVRDRLLQIFPRVFFFFRRELLMFQLD